MRRGCVQDGTSVVVRYVAQMFYDSENYRPRTASKSMMPILDVVMVVVRRCSQRRRMEHVMTSYEWPEKHREQRRECNARHEVSERPAESQGPSRRVTFFSHWSRPVRSGGVSTLPRGLRKVCMQLRSVGGAISYRCFTSRPGVFWSVFGSLRTVSGHAGISSFEMAIPCHATVEALG